MDERKHVGPGGYSDDYGPNVATILAQGTRVVRNRIPRQVRNELMAAVKAGVLGHLKKDGLKPEIFFHPDHKNGAIDRQKREAEYAIGCIKKVFVCGSDLAEHDIEFLARQNRRVEG